MKKSSKLAIIAAALLAVAPAAESVIPAASNTSDVVLAAKKHKKHHKKSKKTTSKLKKMKGFKRTKKGYVFKHTITAKVRLANIFETSGTAPGQTTIEALKEEEEFYKGNVPLPKRALKRYNHVFHAKLRGNVWWA